MRLNNLIQTWLDNNRLSPDFWMINYGCQSDLYCSQTPGSVDDLDCRNVVATVHDCTCQPHYEPYVIVSNCLIFASDPKFFEKLFKEIRNRNSMHLYDTQM